MSLYTRARRHIDMKRVKEMREEKIKREKIAEILRQQEEIRDELEYIEAEESKHSDWRTEVSEQMTSSGMFFTTLPAAGDVNLENVTKTATPGSENSGGSGGTYSFGDYDETGNGGFTLFLDTTKFDTFKFSLNKGGATTVTVSINSGGFQTLSSGSNLVTLSSSNRTSNTQFLFNAAKTDGSGSTGASISGTAFQRRHPVNAFVGLDDPEASSFIRGGLGGSEERKQKLKEQLDAGNELMIRMGLEPNKTSPGDIELNDVTSDAIDPGMGTGDIAALPLAAGLLATPMGQAALAAGAATVATLLGITIQKAQELVNQVNSMSGTDYGAAPGRETIGNLPGRGGIAGGRELTPDQQAEVKAAADELRDARRALNDLPADATDAQKDMAQERLDRASKNRQRVRNKHKQENQQRPRTDGG